MPSRSFTPDNVQLFLYNAILWNPHRIHFDQPYACDEEGYPGLVVPGPLMGDWLSQILWEWLADEGSVLTFSYRNRRAAYAGETLYGRGEVREVDAPRQQAKVHLTLSNEAQETLVPAEALIKFGTP